MADSTIYSTNILAKPLDKNGGQEISPPGKGIQFRGEGGGDSAYLRVCELA